MSRKKQDFMENVSCIGEDPKPSDSSTSNNYMNCKTMKICEKTQSENQQQEDEDSELSEDECSGSPSILKIMAKNHSSISEAAKFNVEVAPNVGRSIKSITEQADVDDAHPSSDVHQKNGADGDVNELSAAIGKTHISDNKSATRSNDNKLLVQNKEIEAVSSFLGDANVQQLIKSVAGGETTSFIDKTLEAVNSSKSIQEKRAIVTGGIKQLHSDLLVNKDKIARDPLFSLALGVAGINRRSINFD